MHIVSKFQFFYSYLCYGKTEKKRIKSLKRGEKTGKNGEFLPLLQNAVSP